jgi:23S rRNA (guanosine2251-2'-O)-methyltransferase
VKRLPLVVILDNVRSLHNVGAIFRSADATRVEKIILCGLTPMPPRTEIDKTALGATASVPWEYRQSIHEIIAELVKNRYTLYALEQSGSATDIFHTSLSLPAALVVGHEREGVSNEVLAVCNHHLQIPMYGASAHSLNVSTSTTVALYQFSMQFCYDGETLP